MMNPEYEINTKIFENGLIKQQLKTPYDIEHYVAEWIVDTSLDHIKKALIELGWTPPKDK